ncbi:DUF2380 domain-containing protein [Ancylobacter oerskovii]|uniref:DUF2380 domain-containing protein n=1 Tax=Ancylobacter oerskovii TaxID=459519 RepID=A0ABW4Z1K5_9HYPH|nr:DUF2380 domain-containing protein [Ancylobacter oerskovii]MBS7545032.1 DUF2380 domain-containing protein [Ancylobacter oerskovii]
MRGCRALFVVAALMSPVAASQAEASSRTVAIADFQYIDTSGEARDQKADHASRLEAFMTALHRDLAASDMFRVVPLPCRPCVLTDGNAAKIAGMAQKAGAEFLLVGGIQKMSTLVQWAKVALIDLRTDEKVLERLYTFRGDNDEAWRNAESFISRQIIGLSSQ